MKKEMKKEKRLIEYISREEVCKLCDNKKEYCGKEKCPVYKAPETDVVPAVHGRWIPNFEYDFDRGEHRLTGYHCDKCGIWTLQKSNYCPNCGSKMDGERKDNESMDG